MLMAYDDSDPVLPPPIPGEPESGVELFTHIQPVWDRMYRDCAAAQNAIYFEQYILGNDETGNAFLKLFEQKAREGVSVTLIFDYIGSREIYGAAAVDAIRAAGGTVEFYNVLTWRDIAYPSRWLPRNHCKTLIIDDRLAYVGSACFADVMKDWRDFHLRLDNIPVPGLLDNVPGPATMHFRYLTHTPRQKPNPIYNEFLQRIARAEKNVYIATPYFFPPFALRRAMRDAVARGVNVTIMLSKKSDVPLLSFFTRSYFPWLINRGIHIVMYTESLLHAKYVVIDDNWAMLGSTNVDYLSLRYNREGNIMIMHDQTIATLRGIFEKDLLLCEEADEDPGIFLKIFMPLVRVVRRWM